jgi:hypothetical protein
VVLAEPLELDEEALAQVGGPDPDGIEGLDERLRRLEVGHGDAHVEAEVLEVHLEESVLPDVADQRRGDLADARTGLGETELVGEVVLQRDRFDDRVHHELVLLVGIVAFRGGKPRLGHVFAPLLVELGEFGEFPVEVLLVARAGFLEGNVGRLLLEGRILDEFLLDQLAQLEGRGLQQLQALLHLGRNRLLLQQRLGLIKPLFGHRGGFSAENFRSIA